MKSELTKFAQAAGIMLAMVFTLSCSNGNDDDGGSKYRTYYAASYGINDRGFCEYLDELALGNGDVNLSEDDIEGKGYSFSDYKNSWNQYKTSGKGVLLGSQSGYTEDYIKDFATAEGLGPTDITAYMRGLNNRGNQLSIHFSADNAYCYIVVYVEKE